MKKSISFAVIILAIAGIGWYTTTETPQPFVISNYDECVAAGNPVAETYPPQCRAGETWFVLDVGNFVEKLDEAHVINPSPQEAIPNNYLIHGSANSDWFISGQTTIQILNENEEVLFEGSVDVVETNPEDGRMRFEKEITYNPEGDVRGFFVFTKANDASGAVQYPIKFTNQEFE